MEILVADIGGTNSRFALVGGDSLELMELRKYPNRDFTGLENVITHYLRDTAATPKRACIAVAGPVLGDDIHLTNVDWRFSTEQLQSQLGLNRLVVTNDFTALAMAIPHLHDSGAIAQIGEGTPKEKQPISVVGPGTGLGVSGLLWSGTCWTSIEGEGGQIAFAPGNTLEIGLLQYAQKHYGFVSAERFISGSGMVFLHQALLELAGKAKDSNIQPEDITRQAKENSCADCRRTIEVFCGMLGAFVGDRALEIGAFGGVYIGGGVTPQLEYQFEKNGFRQRFEDKGRFSEYGRPIPTYWLRSHSQVALLGAAIILRQQETP